MPVKADANHSWSQLNVLRNTLVSIPWKKYCDTEIHLTQFSAQYISISLVDYACSCEIINSNLFGITNHFWRKYTIMCVAPTAYFLHLYCKTYIFTWTCITYWRGLLFKLVTTDCAKLLSWNICVHLSSNILSRVKQQQNVYYFVYGIFTRFVDRYKESSICGSDERYSCLKKHKHDSSPKLHKRQLLKKATSSDSV